MSKDDLLPISVVGERLVPHFLGEVDHPWLRALLDERDRFVGRHQRELDERLREPLPCASPPKKTRLAIQVLLRHCAGRSVAGPAAARARAALFGEAARSPSERTTVLERAAATIGLTPDRLEEALFADLPGERPVLSPAAQLSPLELALRANLALTRSLLARSSEVRIFADGNARSLVRLARLRGLLCTISPGDGDESASLAISGPFALFRHTQLYGRALGDLLPQLAWCRRFRLVASCVHRDRRLTLQLGTGDPIFPSAEPRRFDSRLEERFAREFSRAAPEWNLLREPEAFAAGGALVFPDFAIEHRTDRSRRWLLEIVGFWTPDYLARKLARYRAAHLTNLILCIDEERACADADLPQDARVIRFRRRVDPGAILGILEGGSR